MHGLGKEKPVNKQLKVRQYLKVNIRLLSNSLKISKYTCIIRSCMLHKLKFGGVQRYWQGPALATSQDVS